MKVRLTPNWFPTDMFGTSCARSLMSCTPPGFNASEPMAEIDAGVSINAAERRVAVTTISSRPESLAGAAAV